MVLCIVGELEEGIWLYSGYCCKQDIFWYRSYYLIHIERFSVTSITVFVVCWLKKNVILLFPLLKPWCGFYSYEVSKINIDLHAGVQVLEKHKFSDMENVKTKNTWVQLFIPKCYPKVRKLRQNKKCNKTVKKVT